MNQVEVTMCLGCGEPFVGLGMCPDCAKLDAIYESRRAARVRLLDDAERERVKSAMPREDVGLTDYTQPTSQAGLAVVMLLGFLTGALVYGYLGKSVISFLCGGGW